MPAEVVEFGFGPGLSGSLLDPEHEKVISAAEARSNDDIINPIFFIANYLNSFSKTWG